jgi:hypothetical protein
MAGKDFLREAAEACLQPLHEPGAAMARQAAA